MQKKDKRDQLFEVRLTKADVNWLEMYRRRKKYLVADVGELIQQFVDREVNRLKPRPAPNTPSDYKMPPQEIIDAINSLPSIGIGELSSFDTCLQSVAWKPSLISKRVSS